MIAAAGFLTEYVWPVGDLRWAYVLAAGAVAIPLLYSPEIWGFISRQAKKIKDPDTELGPLPLPPPIIPKPRTVTPSAPTPPQPITPDHNTWITEAEALHMIRSSSLVRLRLPWETTAAEHLLRIYLGAKTKTKADDRADEISRHLLRKFEKECPQGVRGGMYDLRLLQEWIDQEAYGEPL